MRKKLFAICFLLLLIAKSGWADPTVLTRIIGGGVVLFGTQPSGRGGATLAIMSPATLWKAPPVVSVDYGYSTLTMNTALGKDTAVLNLIGGGFVIPLENKWAFAFRFGMLDTNKFNQQKNHFAPRGSEPFLAQAEDTTYLFAMGKSMGKGFSLGMALPLFGKSRYEISSATATRVYQSMEKFSPLFFAHWQIHPKFSLGAQLSYINVVQIYEGSEFAAVGLKDLDGQPVTRFEAQVTHYEYKLGVGFNPWKGAVLAIDGEYHVTNAPLHPILGKHEGHGIDASFDSTAWYAGFEQGFSFGLPVDVLVLRAGVLDEKSPTFGFTHRCTVGTIHVQIDYAFIRNHSKNEFDEFEPGLFGESSDSHGMSISIPFGAPKG